MFLQGFLCGFYSKARHSLSMFTLSIPMAKMCTVILVYWDNIKFSIIQNSKRLN